MKIFLVQFFCVFLDFPGGSDGKASAYNAGDWPGFNPWVRKISWRRKWQPTPLLLPGKSHGQRNPVGYSPWGRKELVTTEQVHFSVYSCHLFLISSASLRSMPFISFLVTYLAWNVPLVSLIFLKRSLVFTILLFSSISLHWSLRKAFFSFLAILWNSAFKWLYLLFSFAFSFSSILSYL